MTTNQVSYNYIHTYIHDRNDILHCVIIQLQENHIVCNYTLGLTGGLGGCGLVGGVGLAVDCVLLNVLLVTCTSVSSLGWVSVLGEVPMVTFLLTHTNHMIRNTMTAVMTATKIRVRKNISARASLRRRPEGIMLISYN